MILHAYTHQVYGTGLFRISGLHKMIENIKARLNKGECNRAIIVRCMPCLSHTEGEVSFETEAEVNAVASLIKQFLVR